MPMLAPHRLDTNVQYLFMAEESSAWFMLLQQNVKLQKKATKKIMAYINQSLF